MATASVSFQYGNSSVTLETGKVARQASGAVIVTMGDTVVMASVVGSKSAVPGRDFFPLTVDYQERTYAAGKIPGGFFKREGRPTEKETLTCRLIDRPIRPLFPKGFGNEVQIICTVMSLDPAVDPDIVAMIGASAALGVSGLPFAGPIAAARVGYRDGQYLLNPSFSALEDSALDLVVAGTSTSVLMVESEAKGLSEEVMLGAVVFGHEQMQVAIAAIKDLIAQVNPAPWAWQPPEPKTALVDAINAKARAAIIEAYAIVDKLARRDRLSALRSEIVAALSGGDAPQWTAAEVAGVFSDIEHDAVRSSVIAGAKTYARSQSRSASCPAPTVPHCSRAARPRQSWSLRSVPGAIRRSSTRSRANAAKRSCCTTTFRPSAWVKSVVSAHPSGAKSATAGWPSAQSRASCPI